ncbi:hypothetical protein [Rhizobium terrae]|uniref:hypothetical protein n=1 Tax=Rhizobium terrae TaxID=2171756 RepID=UPI0013C2C3EA|nr:hypothetical protein [Rhizobium terrae]
MPSPFEAICFENGPILKGGDELRLKAAFRKDGTTGSFSFLEQSVNHRSSSEHEKNEAHKVPENSPRVVPKDTDPET